MLNRLLYTTIAIIYLVCLGGLGVTCSPRDPGFDQAKVHDFIRA